jgi:hypothetical protein
MHRHLFIINSNALEEFWIFRMLIVLLLAKRVCNIVRVGLESAFYRVIFFLYSLLFSKIQPKHFFYGLSFNSKKD